MNTENINLIKELIIFTVIYSISVFLSMSGLYFAAGLILIVSGILMYAYEVRLNGKLLSPSAVLNLSWVSCIGISLLKLSFLQTDWELKTYVCFYLFLVLFKLSYAFHKTKRDYSLRTERTGRLFTRKTYLYVITVLTALSYIAFLVEASVLRYVPLFTVDTPHAYSYFHVSGVHYFTVLCVLVPGLIVNYLIAFYREITTGEKVYAAFLFALNLILPVLLVSRFQLVFAVFLAAISLVLNFSDRIKSLLKPKYVLLAVLSVAMLLAVYVFITIERAHSVEYLNGIFEMKNPETPIWITQPYIYIANNFDNFNCMISEIGEHSFGLKQLFPVFALTGLKFLFPDLLSFPLFVTKEELTTVTILYDAYYDFGIIGVIVFAILLGILCKTVYTMAENVKGNLGPIVKLICAQLIGYIVLAFFTTWFSNPTTWFYLGICVAIIVAVMLFNRKRYGSGEPVR
ncbi:MAG: O-antigen polymerase [Eubacteriales bacterium]|nr:O-antigen polymerase [Eubacteriales bacterium]